MSILRLYCSHCSSPESGEEKSGQDSRPTEGGCWSEGEAREAASENWVGKGSRRYSRQRESRHPSKRGAVKENPEEPQVTEGGWRQEWKRMRERERKVAGAGGGRVVRWERKARLNYVHCQTGKGNLQSWRAKLDDTVDPTCRTCGRHVEIGRHVALVCPRGEEIGRKWGDWEEMDERKKWMKKIKDGGGEYTVDLVETFFSNLDLG